MSTIQKRIITAALMLSCALALFSQERVISVMYFQNTTNTPDYAWLSKGIADMLITDIAGAGNIKVVERADLEKILREQELAVSDLFDAAGAVRIGKLVSAREAVCGSFIIQGATIRIDARLVSIETGQVVKGFAVSGKTEAVFGVEKNLAQQLLVGMGVSVAAGMKPSDTQSLDAAKAYYTGIQLLDEGAFDKASGYFRQASSIDPYYLKPQRSLEEAYRFLKDFRSQRYQREILKLYLLAADFKERLNASSWMSYSDFITWSYQKGMSQADKDKYLEEHPSLMQGDTKAQATWNLQCTLMEIADKSEEYFEDTGTGEKMYREILFIGEQARKQFATDPFLTEILYMELFCYRHFEDWEKLMESCEYLMEKYPAYRMMWAVENFYETAIEKLDDKK